MPQKSKPRVEYAGFIQLELNESDIAAIEGSTLTPEELILHIGDMCRNRYKIALEQPEFPGNFRCTAQDTDVTRTSGGWMLSAEGPDVTSAITCLLYKHEAMMHRDWIPFLAKAREVKRFR